jgi:hypothetical protein
MKLQDTNTKMQSPRAMSRALFFVMFLGLIASGSCESQTEKTYQNLSLGASLGKGYAIDIGYGKRTVDSGSAGTGWDLLFSIWTPDWRFPFTFSSLPTLTPDEVTAGAQPTSSKDDRLGFGLGTRCVFSPFQLGVMFDIMTDHHYDYYTNGFTYQQYALRNDVTLGGWTATAAYDITSRYTATAFYGTRRGINVGVVYNIVNP